MKEKVKEILIYIGIIVLILILITFGIFYVWIRIEFADIPLADVPVWALPFIK